MAAEKEGARDAMHAQMVRGGIERLVLRLMAVLRDRMAAEEEGAGAARVSAGEMPAETEGAPAAHVSATMHELVVEEDPLQRTCYLERATALVKHAAIRGIDQACLAVTHPMVGDVLARVTDA